MSVSESPAACPPPLMWQDVRREYFAQSTERVVETPVGPLSVRSLGNGPPVYFLPGLSAPAEFYALMIWLLRDEFRCVTVEPAQNTKVAGSAGFAEGPVIAHGPGHHKVSVPATLNEQAKALITVADELHDQTITLFGADYGAAWALSTARQHPQRINRLVLLQAFAHRRFSFGERRFIGLGTWFKRPMSQLPWRDTVQTQNHRRWFPPFDETRWQYYLETSGQLPVREVARRAQQLVTYDLRSDLAQITTPTLLVRTEGDGRIAEQAGEELARHLPNAKTEWLHNTGHLAYLTHPHRLAKLVRTS